VRAQNAIRAILAGALLLGACGDDSGSKTPPPAPPRAGPPPASGAPAAGAAAPGAAGQPGKMVLFPKVPKDYRADLKPDVFLPDPSGELNRDPFRSYLIQTTSVAGAGQPTRSRADRCGKKVFASHYGLPELELIGVLSGRGSAALFRDPQKLGHIVRIGDCISKDKARVVKIEGSTVELELVSDVTTDAVAPPPHIEVKRLHPVDTAMEPEE
jgi:Tfp pilus assembly protein PilP